MKKDKSKIKISLEKWELKNLYEILNDYKKILENTVLSNTKVKDDAELEAIDSILPKIIKVFQ